MKKLLLVLTVVAMASFLLVGCLGTTPDADEVVTIAIIPGVTAPVTGATPVAATTATAQYTGVVIWLPDDVTFAAETVYTATITLTAKAGFTLTGVTADFFTVASATAANLVDSGIVEAVFPATLVTPVAPVIAAIDNQTISWGEDFEHQVTLTAGTDLTPTYSLAATRVANAIGLEIDADGLITWTPLEVQVGLYEVTVTATDTVDSSLSDTEVFTILVEDPAPPVDLTVESIVYEDDHSYNDGTTQFVRGGSGDDCVGVTVTLSEAVGEDDVVNIRWNDGETEGSWVALTADTANEVFTGDLCFDDSEILECELVCVEVQLVTPDLFCPACVGTETLIHTETVNVDKTDPVTDLNIIFDSCAEGTCPAVNSISFTFEPDTTGEFCDPEPCCEEECSGIAFWSIEDITDPCDYCPALTGTGCPEDTYECGCLLCSELTEPVVYELYFTFADNVGNEFVDTWTITVDSGCAVTAFTSDFMGTDVPTEVVGDDTIYELYDFCPPVPVLAE